MKKLFKKMKTDAKADGTVSGSEEREIRAPEEQDAENQSAESIAEENALHTAQEPCFVTADDESAEISDEACTDGESAVIFDEDEAYADDETEEKLWFRIWHGVKSWCVNKLSERSEERKFKREEKKREKALRKERWRNRERIFYLAEVKTEEKAEFISEGSQTLSESKVKVWFKKSYKTVKRVRINLVAAKNFFFGTDEHRGFLLSFVRYALLILFGFVYLYPLLYMLAYSFMSSLDITNPAVNYLPTEIEWSNYTEAIETLDYWNTLLSTILVAVLPALAQTVACCLTAYGLARFRFPGKRLMFALILLSFIVPSSLIMLPQLLIFTNIGISDTILSFVIPALFGQGLHSAAFILIFYQFFREIPDSVVEAAKIDGANAFVVFWKIAIPSAVSAILLSFLLSVVWYYNETVLSSIYFGSSLTTLPRELEKFQATYTALFGTVSTTGKSVNEAIYMAGTVLTIIPLIIMYFFTQKYFVEGIDKAGITGE